MRYGLRLLLLASLLLVSALPASKAEPADGDNTKDTVHIVFSNHLVPKNLIRSACCPLGWFSRGFEGSLGSRVQSKSTQQACLRIEDISDMNCMLVCACYGLPERYRATMLRVCAFMSLSTMVHQHRQMTSLLLRQTPQHGVPRGPRGVSCCDLSCSGSCCAL
jgi:hypothetical protein